MNATVGDTYRKQSTNRSHRTGSPETRGERKLVSPFRCRVWTQHARPDEQLTESACRSLRESIAKNGQHQPALGRPVTDDPAYDVEIICGARRHAAALTLGRDLLVEVRTINDAEAYVAMYEENSQRKDDCPYVQGQILRRALLSGSCTCQEELACTFGLSRSKTSRLLMVAQLPSIIVAAFQSPRDIREHWGVELYQLWKKSNQEYSVTTRARLIANREPRLSPRETYDTLVTAAPSIPRTMSHSNRSLPVRGKTGIVLFREQDQTKSVVFTVPKEFLSNECHDALKQAMVRILEAPGSESAGSTMPKLSSP